MSNLIWEKKISQNLTLQEYENPNPTKPPYQLSCIVVYEDLEEDWIKGFYFNGWGINRELITFHECVTVITCFLYEKVDSSVCSFYKNYLHYSLVIHSQSTS